MAFKTKTDMTVYNFLQHLPEDKADGMNIMMYDTEPVPFELRSWNAVPFDVGYRPFNVFGGQGKEGGGLVYEVIRHRELMTQLHDQRKVREPAEDSLYHVLKYLRDEEQPGTNKKGWFSEKMDNAYIYGVKTGEKLTEYIIDDIDQIIFEHDLDVRLPKHKVTAEEVYEKVVLVRSLTRDAVEHFTNMETQSDVTRVKEINAKTRARHLDSLLTIYADYLSKTQGIKQTMLSLRREGSEAYRKLQNLRKEWVKENYSMLRVGRDLNEAEDLAFLRTVPGGEAIQPARKIFGDYEKEFKQCVGIMGHNLVNSDLRWTRTLLKELGLDEYMYLFDPDEINAFCSMQILKRLYSLEGTELLDTMLSANAQELAPLFKENAKDLPNLPTKGMSLEVLVKSIFDDVGQQKHTAIADVDWTIKLFQKVAEDFVEGELTERK